uniref:Transposase n=1 Tax=Syphacia muris TaxID=451379 RepID=A0A0N5AT50_9BILA
MHASMQKLVNQHEELREQLEQIQRALLLRDEYGKNFSETSWLSVDSHEQNSRNLAAKNTGICRNSSTALNASKP